MSLSKKVYLFIFSNYKMFSILLFFFMNMLCFYNTFLFYVAKLGLNFKTTKRNKIFRHKFWRENKSPQFSQTSKTKNAIFQFNDQ